MCVCDRTQTPLNVLLPLLLCCVVMLCGYVMLLCPAAAGNGFFINTALLMYSMLVNAWLCLLLVLLNGVTSTGTVLDDSLAVVGGLQVLQLGSLSVLVYVATVWLEDGFFTTIKNVLKQFVAGARLWHVAVSVGWLVQSVSHTGGPCTHRHTAHCTPLSAAHCVLQTLHCVLHMLCAHCALHTLSTSTKSDQVLQCRISRVMDWHCHALTGCVLLACCWPAGSLFFYVFRGQTSAYAFNSDLAYGGATYAATGRGYKLRVRQGFRTFLSPVLLLLIELAAL